MARAKKIKPTTKRIKILIPVANKFQLSYNVGKEYEMESKQANELIEAKYAIEVK